MRIAGASASFLGIENNKIAGNLEIHIDNIEVMNVKKNKFNQNFIIRQSALSSEFDFTKNVLKGKLALTASRLPENTSCDIDWRSLNNFHLGLNPWDNRIGISVFPDGRIDFTPIDSTKFVTGARNAEISDDEIFRELMGLYSVFLNIYKTKNDIESYNNCFIQIKELQSKRLKYLYESHKTFETYFSWKLSQLLKFYVRYGTNPARAIVISIYIIIAFGIFFFFFPSDWDTTSKKKLIQNFKDFIQKNEKGYLKPFFILLFGFALSLINAVTLSLNAFITLGFGNIPTHGIARYFCVLEGFLGWFLLSNFTVAMINQVL
jgi:hypothetical protein